MIWTNIKRRNVLPFLVQVDENIVGLETLSRKPLIKVCNSFNVFLYLHINTKFSLVICRKKSVRPKLNMNYHIKIGAQYVHAYIGDETGECTHF